MTHSTPSSSALSPATPTRCHGIYVHFAPRLHRFVLVRVRERADCDDLVQRVFLKMIEALPRYEAARRPVRGVGVPACAQHRHRLRADAPVARDARRHRRAARRTERAPHELACSKPSVLRSGLRS